MKSKSEIKTELEQILTADHSSVRLMVNPNLSDFFFWHFHPEFELVFIDGANGTRHVGEHVARFHGSDLVLIGSNIPHLNFDYGIKTPYEKMVVHLKKDFLQHALPATPELHLIAQLFEESKYGVGFGPQSKQLVGDRIKNLHHLAYFDLFVELLQIFHLLAKAEDRFLLHDHPVLNQFSEREVKRIQMINQFIDKNYHRKIEIAEVAELAHLTIPAFCRYFKRITRLTFTEFLNHYRVDKAKRILLLDSNVTEAAFQCGFESISYFNKVFKKVTRENPLAFKKKHKLGT